MHIVLSVLSGLFIYLAIDAYKQGGTYSMWIAIILAVIFGIAGLTLDVLI